ncbi:tat pathway signal sequence protein [Rutstroemia sp. NJR-2017a BVV2]|nr:tat pathway signal sequence protein [Rutstroemia sp. NJR-2017a BVV2]
MPPIPNPPETMGAFHNRSRAKGKAVDTDTSEAALDLMQSRHLEERRLWSTYFKTGVSNQLVLSAPRVLVGLLGYTGIGKSSLINSLLDEEMIVPANAMRASTTVVTEISWNESDDPDAAHRTEIEFINESEWKAEVEILVQDIANKSTGENITVRSGTDASIAFAKISAVYPEVCPSALHTTTADDFLRQHDYSPVLGSTICLQNQNSNDFSHHMKTYIDSSNKNSATRRSFTTMAYWSLVRCVRIYTKTEVLRHGLVLVDLPGLGDSNAARVQVVVQNYKKRLTYTWIIADIIRAVDDQVAKHLMGQSYKRQLLMDSKYDSSFLTFFRTKTDVINTGKVMRSLNLIQDVLQSHLSREMELQDELCRIQAEILAAEVKKRAIRSRMKELQSALKFSHGKRLSARKRKHLALSTNEQASSEIYSGLGHATQGTIKREIRQLKVTSGESLRQIKALKKSVVNIGKSLSVLQIDIKHICIRARNDYTHDQFATDFENGLRELQHDLWHDSEGLAENGPSNDGLIEPVPKQFPALEDTNIPDLQEHAAALTTTTRRQMSDRFLDNLNLLKLSIQAWAGDESALLSSSQKDEMNEINIESIILPTLDTCVRLSVENCDSLGREITRSIQYQTFKASRRNAEYDWNETFVTPFMNPLAVSWHLVFNKRMQKLKGTFIDEAIKEFCDCPTKIEALMQLISPNAPKNFSESLPHRRSILEQQFRVSWRNAQKQLKDLYRKVNSLIGERLEPAYGTCSQESSKH